MCKTISYLVAVVLLTASSLMGKSDYRTWSVTFAGGWQGSLTLNPKADDGVKSGSFFWLFAERDILWDEDSETITIIYRRPRLPLDGYPPKLRFRKNAGSLVPMADGLEAAEHKSLASTPWKPGGPDPGQLASSSSATPYSKAHEKEVFILDVSTIPAPLARHALRVFDDDEAHLIPMILHPGLSPESLNEIWENARLPVGSRRPGSILRALATNPRLPKDLLRKLWERSFEDVIRAADLPYLASRHPAADPDWYQTVLRKLLEDGDKSDLLRKNLEQSHPLSPEVLDHLIRYHTRSGESISADLAMRKDLSPAQIESLFMPGNNPQLISRADFPPHLFEKAAGSDSRGVLFSIVRNPAAPPETVQQVLRKFCEKPEFRQVYRSFELDGFVAGHPLLPGDLQQNLAKHIDPQVRRILAGNGALAVPLRRQLAADPFACVARTAREALSKEPDADTTAFLASLPALDTLNPAEGFRGAARATLEADNPKAFRSYQDAQVGTPDNPADDWSQTMIELGAIRCLQDQVESGKLTVQNLAANAFLQGWTPQMTDLALGKTPDPHTIEAFALSIVQNGRAEDFESLEKRNIDLGFVRESPLVWHAVARRDESMLKRLISLHADPTISNEGVTPAQLAVRIHFVAALGALPLDDGSRSGLEAFRKRFPGDPKAAWLGDWIYRKAENAHYYDEGENAVVLRFESDGAGSLFTAPGNGIPIAWVRPEPNRSTIEISVFDETGKEHPAAMTVRVEESKLTLNFDGVERALVRPEWQK